MAADSFLATWLASLWLEAGVAGFVAGYWWIGGALVSAGAAILVRRLKVAGMLSQRTIHGIQMAAFGVALWVGLFLMSPHRPGFTDPDAKVDTGGIGSGKYRGVILWTEQKHKQMVMTRPPERGKGHNKNEQNWRIPFDGVYWFFKYPDRRPPAGSYSLNGSPAKIAFRSADAFALEMEARQNFVNPLEMSCCSRIAVEINNADTYPGTILLELTLSNLRVPGEPVERLGRVPVRPAHQAVSFAMPENPRIQEFDSATVKFIRASGRNFRSAKIAIEAFTLTPR